MVTRKREHREQDNKPHFQESNNENGMKKSTKNPKKMQIT